MTKKKEIEAAMKRLRAEAEARGVRDENGRVKYEGSPLPESVERELRHMWALAKKARAK